MNKVYIAHKGYLNKHGRQTFDMIGVYENKDRAIQDIEKSIEDVNGGFIEITPVGNNIYWSEKGMDIITVGFLEERTLIKE